MGTAIGLAIAVVFFIAVNRHLRERQIRTFEREELRQKNYSIGLRFGERNSPIEAAVKESLEKAGVRVVLVSANRRAENPDHIVIVRGSVLGRRLEFEIYTPGSTSETLTVVTPYRTDRAAVKRIHRSVIERLYDYSVPWQDTSIVPLRSRGLR